MYSGSLIYLLHLGEVTEEVMGGATSQLPTSFWTFTRFGRKLVRTIQLAASLNLPSRS
jgi:hypothetical protein